jgi:hypothetical protein
MGENSGGVRDILWWLGSVALLIAPAQIWSNTPLAEFRRPPDSPIDRSAPHGAAHWRLVSKAAAVLPGDASVTFRAASRDDEMSMFMIAVGLMPAADLRPSSYWNGKVTEGAAAEYVVAFQAGADIEPGSELIGHWPEGVLLRRGAQR